MEIIKDEKRFRYLSGVIKYLNKIKQIRLEEEILEFEIKFDGSSYHLKYKFRW